MADKYIKKLADVLCGLIFDKRERDPEAYDTKATVRRIEDGKAYVHIPGGVDETPVDLTIDAKAGDTVQVRVSGGRAWLVGNRTAPPTDDTTARTAQGTAAKAEVRAEQAEETANGVNGIANSALVQAAAAKQIADDTEQHFWFQETGADTGAHITEVTQDEWNDSGGASYHKGGNFLARSNGAAVRDGLKELATMSQSGFDAKTYDSNDDEIIIAHLGYGNANAQGGGTQDAPYYTLGTRPNTPNGVGAYSSAEGSGIEASGPYSHGEGLGSMSRGVASHAEGAYTRAEGITSHAGGFTTEALYDYQTAIGKYNNNKSGDLFEVGNGTSDSARSNAFEVDQNGDAIVQGDLTASNIGAKNWVTPSAVSCQTGKWYKVAEVTLDPGIWLIDCNAAFPNTNATGTRQIRATTATFTNGTTTAPASYGNITNDVLVGAATAQYPQVHFPVDISSQTTFRLAAYQGSGSTVSVTGRMYATRIK